MDAWIGSTWFAGRKYIVAPLLIKPRKVGAKGRKYIQHVIYMPKHVARTLYSRAEKDPKEGLPVLALLTPTAWYHILNQREEPIHAYNQLPRDIRLELEALGLAPKQEYKPLTILARQEEIKKLGLDPSKPTTLEELEKKILEKHGIH